MSFCDRELGKRLRALTQGVRAAWREEDPSAKCLLVADLESSLDAVTAILEEVDDEELKSEAIALDDIEPGRPEKPHLVHPASVARRQTGRAGGRGAMLHAIAHIEFNAINLALDAAWRYPDMPPRFVCDWVFVAIDEARHFSLLCSELRVEGLQYGDFDAHDGLWKMARLTASDLVARMALVPRVLEARGLDATPVIQRKLSAVGDTAGVDLLQIILDDEIRHVKIGDTWFRRLCTQAGKNAEATYRDMLRRFEAPLPKAPMNDVARREAGFSDAELQWLADAGAKHSRLRSGGA